MALEQVPYANKLTSLFAQKWTIFKVEIDDPDINPSAMLFAAEEAFLNIMQICKLW